MAHRNTSVAELFDIGRRGVAAIPIHTGENISTGSTG